LRDFLDFLDFFDFLTLRDFMTLRDFLTLRDFFDALGPPIFVYVFFAAFMHCFIERFGFALRTDFKCTNHGFAIYNIMLENLLFSKLYKLYKL